MDQTRKNSEIRKDRPLSLLGGLVPPQAVELEKAVLGAIMLERDAFDIASEVVNSDCFYSESHKLIFETFQTLARKHLPIDMMTVIQELNSKGQLDQVGGAYAVTSLTKGVVSSAHIDTHCRIIFQKYLNREMIRLSSEIQHRAFADEDCFDLLDFAEQSFGELDSNSGSGMIHISKVVMQAVKQVQEWKNAGTDLTGVPSGFADIDAITRGWQPGDLILIGARPSVGKTAMALNLVRNAAQNKAKPTTVAVWSLEMKAMFLVLRMLAAESKIFLDKLQTGRLSNEEMSALMKQAGDTLSNLGIFFDEKSSVSISSIVRKAKKLKKSDNLGLIVIDYLQLVQGDDKKVREQQIAKISRDLKNLAQDINIPVIALSQLSRETGSKGISWDSGPPPSALRESGALEQDADLIGMLWGPGDEDVKQDTSIAKKRRFRVVKHRNGVLGTVEFDFRNEIQLFETIEQVTGMKSWRPVSEVRNFYETDREDEDLPF